MKFFLRKGIELGDREVRNWLISLIITILTGIFVTQPFQVRNKISILFCKIDSDHNLIFLLDLF